MERRWCSRKPVQLDALVFHPTAGLLRGRVINISLEGIFFQGGGPSFPPASILEVTFSLERNAPLHRLQHAHAIVAHQTRAGYGLLFHDFNSGVFQTICDMVYAA